MLRLVIALAALPTALGTSKCSLVSLVLRYLDWPIDLEPAFRADLYEYRAVLDFTMETFGMDARPTSGCVVAGVPMAPVPVPIGGSASHVTVYAMHPDNREKQPYTIRLARLLGSETGLKLLQVVGAKEFVPAFDPTIREYFVTMNIGYDIVRVTYMLQDTEQNLHSNAEEQFPAGKGGAAADNLAPPAAKGNGTNGTDGRRLRSGAGFAAAGDGLAALAVAPQRRLIGGEETAWMPEKETGEAQFLYRSVDFMMDVGFKRTITLTVMCADPTQASLGTYTLRVSRPICDQDHPYYNSESRSCQSNCDVGYYRNLDTHRCSHCNQNCDICEDLLTCQMCRPDTEDFTYVIQSDGRCEAVVTHLYKKYVPWAIGLGVINACLGMGVLAAFCSWFPQFVSGESRIMVNMDDSTSSDEEPRHIAMKNKRFAHY